MTFKILVFDFWETLVAGNDKKIMEELTKKLGFDDVNSYWKYCDKEWFPTKLDKKSFLKKTMKYKNIKTNIPEILKLWEKATETNKLFDDVMSNLEKLSKKYKLVLLSSTGTEYSDKFIESLGIRKFFYKIILSCNVGLAKPNLDFFKLVLEETNVKPSEICLIGDSYSNDIIPAEKIGFKTILIDRNGRYQKEINHTVISSLDELEL